MSEEIEWDESVPKERLSSKHILLFLRAMSSEFETIDVCDAVRADGQLMLVAIRGLESSSFEIPPDLAKGLADQYGVEEAILIPWHVEPERFIANAFAPAHVDRVALEYDAVLGAKVAKVFINEDELDQAFGPNGVRPSLVAMLSGQDVEIVINQ
jgi:hypothetical protein